MQFSKPVRLTWLACLLCALGLGCGRGKDSANCPEGSSREESARKPCKPLDKSARLVKASIVGDLKGPFRIRFQNLSDKKIQQLTFKMYFYDAEGKQLSANVKQLGARDYLTMTTEFPSGLSAKAEIEQALGPAPDRIPQGTTTAEVEVIGATWDCAPEKGCAGTWENDDLAPAKRKPVGP